MKNLFNPLAVGRWPLAVGRWPKSSKSLAFCQEFSQKNRLITEKNLIVVSFLNLIVSWNKTDKSSAGFQQHYGVL